MIITHVIKFLYVKAKTAGFVFNEELKNIPYWIISSNIAIQMKLDRYYGQAVTAAWLKEAREFAKKANEVGYVDSASSESIKELDALVKQVFIKVKSSSEYIVVTPVLSCALIDAFTSTARKMYYKSEDHFGYYYHLTQPIDITLANRGELATKNRGIYLIKGIKLNRLINDRSLYFDKSRKCIFFTGEANDVNVNAGFISSGVPALTAIGGLIELAQLRSNLNHSPIPFAFGMKNYSSSNGKIGVERRKGNKVVTTLVLDEIKGSFDFVIALDVTNYSDENISLLSNELLKITRLAGGTIFKQEIKKTIHNDYYFLCKRKKVMKRILKEENVIKGIIEKRLHPVSCGYALLEEPKYRDGVRNCKFNDNIPKHAFAESLFIATKLAPVSYLSVQNFFVRNSFDNCVMYT